MNRSFVRPSLKPAPRLGSRSSAPHLARLRSRRDVGAGGVIFVAAATLIGFAGGLVRAAPNDGAADGLRTPVVVSSVQVEETKKLDVVVSVRTSSAPTFQIYPLPGTDKIAIELPGAQVKGELTANRTDGPLIRGAVLEPKAKSRAARIVLTFADEVDYDASTKKGHLEVVFVPMRTERELRVAWAAELKQRKAAKLAQRERVAQATDVQRRNERAKSQAEQARLAALADDAGKEAAALQSRSQAAEKTRQAGVERSQQAELARRQAEEERRRNEAEAKRLAELEKKRQEEGRRAEEERKRREEEARRLAELEKQRKEELRRAELARKKAEEERKRQEAEEKRLAELERQRREELRKAEIARKKAEEERKRKEAEAKRLAELERKRLEELKKAEEERKRKEAEAKRLAELEKKRKEEERKAEEERKRKEAEAKRLAELERKRLEELKKAEEERKRKEAEAKRLAELAKKKKAEEARRLAELERARKEEEARRLAALEKKRQEELARQKAEEEARRLEEERKRKAAEAQRLAKLEEERKAAERRRQEELARKEREEQARRQAEEKRRQEDERLARLKKAAEERAAKARSNPSSDRARLKAMFEQAQRERERALAAQRGQYGGGTDDGEPQELGFGGARTRAAPRVARAEPAPTRGSRPGSIEIGPTNQYTLVKSASVDSSPFGGPSGPADPDGFLSHITVERDGRSQSRVGVRVDGGARFRIVRKSANELVLTLFDTGPANLNVRRILDATHLRTSIMRVRPHVVEDDGARVDLLIELREPAPVQVQADEKMLWLHVG